jgi:hypothetical protein
MIGSLLAEINREPESCPWLDRCKLDKEDGFLYHLSLTLESMVPFLKGFYLTLNAWRGGRDNQDWKVTPHKLKALLFAQVADGLLTEEELYLALDCTKLEEAPVKKVQALG